MPENASNEELVSTIKAESAWYRSLDKKEPGGIRPAHEFEGLAEAEILAELKKQKLLLENKSINQPGSE